MFNDVPNCLPEFGAGHQVIWGGAPVRSLEHGVRSVLEIVRDLGGAQGGVVDAKFTDGTVKRRIVWKKGPSKEEAVGRDAFQRRQAVGRDGQDPVRKNSHKTGGGIENAGDVEIGLIVKIAPDANDALGWIGIHHSEAKIPRPTMRGEIEVQSPAVNHGIGPLIEDPAPAPVCAKTGPEFKSHRFVASDQTTR